MIIIITWIVKDVIMFPKVWRSYDAKKSEHSDRLIGMNGIVMDGLNPTGYVKIMGELWKAEVIETSTHVDKGKEVKVIKVENMKLKVSTDF